MTESLDGLFEGIKKKTKYLLQKITKTIVLWSAASSNTRFTKYSPISYTIRQALIYRKFCKATFAGYYHEAVHWVHVSLFPFPATVCCHVTGPARAHCYHTLIHVLLSLKCSLYCQAETNFS